MVHPETEAEPELLDQLRAFTALDNPVRLRAFLLIHDRPGVAFNDLASALGVDTGLAAYHVAVLKAGDLIRVSYARSGRTTSSYRISERGRGIFDLLFGSRRRTRLVAARPRPAGGRPAARARSAR